jgi:hypothetical protein
MQPPTYTRLHRGQLTWRLTPCGLRECAEEKEAERAHRDRKAGTADLPDLEVRRDMQEFLNHLLLELCVCWPHPTPPPMRQVVVALLLLLLFPF